MTRVLTPLGHPLPDSPHAVSVSLPTWADVVGYEEYDSRVVNAMQLGYPRFVYHPYVKQLIAQAEARWAKINETCLIFPSRNVAEQCRDFMGDGRIETLESVFAVVFSKEKEAKAKEFWQHTGMICSSRQCEAVLEKKPIVDGTQAKQKMQKRIAGFCKVTSESVYLFPSGMGAIYNTYQALADREGATIQLGFPYVDTLKIQEKSIGVRNKKAYFASSMEEVKELLSREKISAVFTEFPTNPLLQSFDLESLSKLLRAHDVLLIIDDTLSGFYNVTLFPYADAIATSLTKFFSGTGDAMAGALILNPASPYVEKLQSWLKRQYEDVLFAEDAIVIEKNSRDFESRMKRINETAEALCAALKKHTAVEALYYPKYTTPDIFKRYQTAQGGWGGVFSLVLKNEAAAIKFYDRLPISKGPSLGNNFSLACPYTLLAHYHELEFAARCGVPKHLIRVSVGLEAPERLIQLFIEALES